MMCKVFAFDDTRRRQLLTSTHIVCMINVDTYLGSSSTKLFGEFKFVSGSFGFYSSLVSSRSGGR